MSKITSAQFDYIVSKMHEVVEDAFDKAAEQSVSKELKKLDEQYEAAVNKRDEIASQYRAAEAILSELGRKRDRLAREEKQKVRQPLESLEAELREEVLFGKGEPVEVRDRYLKRAKELAKSLPAPTPKKALKG